MKPKTLEKTLPKTPPKTPPEERPKEQQKTLEKGTLLYTLLSWGSWPALLIICLSIFGYGYANDAMFIGLNIAYIFLALTLFQLERIMPFYPEWGRNDGQIVPDIAHTISSKGTVQVLLIFSGAIGVTLLMSPVDQADPYGVWPRDWPLWIQVILGVYAAEFMLYWAHRIGHEVPFMWRFHAVHHSVKRLWIINTGRFHFFDSVVKITMALSLLAVLGAPVEVMHWLTAITAFIGIMTHCNVDMRFGPISYVANTPELHHWHHSMDLREGNRNYGENVVLWDQVFGTYLNPQDRPPPVTIGIEDYMPPKFWQQLLWPFLTLEAKKRIIPEYVPYAEREAQAAQTAAE